MNKKKSGRKLPINAFTGRTLLARVRLIKENTVVLLFIIPSFTGVAAFKIIIFAIDKKSEYG
ncbi:MAG: hypothetical protein FWH52_01585 [Synergistaceae bacterium]|nr:hypothetical protein [Synergistaceae bacterium]